MTAVCPKCLTGGTGYEDGKPCPTPGCDGTVAIPPPFSELIDELPEPMTCGRRFDMYAGGIPAHRDRGEGQDRWQRHKSNGDRVCGYCGSLHPDDFFELVKQCAAASPDAPYGSVPEISPSDKGYKVYVHRNSVRNAHEGGIKFYMQHLPRDAEGKVSVPPEMDLLYRSAVRTSRKRHEAMLAKMFPR